VQWDLQRALEQSKMNRRTLNFLGVIVVIGLTLYFRYQDEVNDFLGSFFQSHDP
jgi:hypothetical protein